MNSNLLKQKAGEFLSSGWAVEKYGCVKSEVGPCDEAINVMRPSVVASWTSWKLGYYSPTETERQGLYLDDYISNALFPGTREKTFLDG